MMKICTKCLQEKTVDLFYKRSDSVGKYTSHCKACKRAHDNAHYAKPETKNAVSEYAKARRADPAVQAKIKAYKFVYERLSEVKERKKNKQRIRRLNPAVIAVERERDALYAKMNPHLFAAKTRKRKAAKLLRTPSWLSDQHKKEINNFYLEAAEISKIVGEFYTVDHIVPLQGKAVSGLHVPWNLQILSRVENSSKGNRIW
jgi:5-methylcytosine-specific restriction endonuclease McrA